MNFKKSKISSKETLAPSAAAALLIAHQSNLCCWMTISSANKLSTI